MVVVLFTEYYFNFSLNFLYSIKRFHFFLLINKNSIDSIFFSLPNKF